MLLPRSFLKNMQKLPNETDQPLELEVERRKPRVQVVKVELADPPRENVIAPNRFFLYPEVSYDFMP
jgi:hypothetical protein